MPYYSDFVNIFFIIVYYYLNNPNRFDPFGLTSLIKIVLKIEVGEIKMPLNSVYKTAFKSILYVLLL